MRFFWLRALFLLGFVVAMPVLALPSVARRVDELLYGPPPDNFGQPPAAALEQESPVAVGEVVAAPAATRRSGMDQESSPRQANVPRSTDIAPRLPTDADPPPLAAVPAFTPLVARQTAAGSPQDFEPKIDEPTIARLGKIRQRLEELGAEYVIAEAVDLASSGSPQAGYRFHCRMLVDARSRFTRPFEATAADPLAAAEQVLREVETWRLASREKP